MTRTASARPRPRPARLVGGLLAATLALTVSSASPVAAAGAADDAARPAYPRHLDLPRSFAPEGIATDRRRPVAYLGNRENGDLLRLQLRTGRTRVLSEGPGTPSLGLKLDRRKRLWVAGGSGGDARVVDTADGEVLATYDVGAEPSFVNDVVLTGHAAWFTDSLQPQLYRVPVRRDLRAQGALRTVPLTGEWEQTEGLNANGIAPTPNERALLVVQTSTGLLFRVDPGTGEATRVRTGGVRLADGDGLLLEGRTLYAVQNARNLVAALRVSPGGRRAVLLERGSSPDFDVPTTVASARGGLYLPNARFSTPDAKRFWVTRIRAR